MEEEGSYNSISKWGGVTDLEPGLLLRVALFGLAIGVVCFLVGAFLKDVVFTTISCGEAEGKTCDAMNADVAVLLSMSLTGIIGLLGLVKIGAYRPIIITVATAICLWPLSTWISGAGWLESLAWHGALFAIFYALFSWLVRPRSLLIAFLLTIPVIVLVRLVAVL